MKCSVHNTPKCTRSICKTKRYNCELIRSTWDKTYSAVHMWFMYTKLMACTNQVISRKHSRPIQFAQYVCYAWDLINIQFCPLIQHPKIYIHSHFASMFPDKKIGELNGLQLGHTHLHFNKLDNCFRTSANSTYDSL